MPETEMPNAPVRRGLHRAALVTLVLLIGFTAGCRREAPQPVPPRPIDGSDVRIIAWLDADSPCQQGTVEILQALEAQTPVRLDVTIIDIRSGEGRERWKEQGFDSAAIEINGNTTVTWGEGDARRTVTFLHPPGFTWTHEDLEAAIDAALLGELLPADPAEAEGVRLMDVSIRGQSIRVGDDGSETGQLIIQDQIVLEITHPRDDLAPGQRVTAAADALRTVLEEPFTPSQLVLKRLDEGIAIVAGGNPLLIASQTDADEAGLSMRQLASQWHSALREALVQAALQRPAAPEPEPEPTEEQPETPANTLANPLEPVTP